MKTLRDREAQTKEEKTSHMTLFCALMMVKNAKATLEQAIRVVPLTGNAKVLAEQLAFDCNFSSEVPLGQISAEEDTQEIS